MKRLVRLGIALLAIVGLVVALLVVRNADDGQEPQASDAASDFMAENPDRVRLLENDEELITTIRVERRDGDPLVISRVDEERFRPEYEYEVEFVQSSVTRLVSQAQSLSSRRVIGEVDDLSEFGLDDPQAILTVERTDGTSQVLRIGNMTPAQDAYYVTRPEDPQVYSVFASWLRPYFTTLDALRARSIPQVAFETLDRIELITLDGREIVAQTIPEWDQDPEMGFAAFAVTAPYDRRYQSNTNWFEATAEQLGALSIVRFVDDAPTNLAQYGLAPPAASLLIRDEETELSFVVGNETEGGRYARFAGSPSVVVLSGADPLLSVEPYDTISAFALIVNIELVDRFIVQSGDTAYVGRIERVEVEGEDDPEERYFLGDDQIDEDLFKDLYQWAIGLQFDAEIDGAAAGPVSITAEPLATIRYELNDDLGEREVSFVPYNNTFVSVVRDGEAQFIMARQKVDRMLNAFREASG